MQWGMTFRNLNKHHCFMVLYILIWGGGLELCFRGAKPTKASPWRLNYIGKLQLAFAIGSEKYLGYTICQACKIRQTLCLQA